MPTVEIWSPLRQSWAPAAPLNGSRTNFAAVSLPAGRVLAIGGFNEDLDALATVEARPPNPASQTPFLQPLSLFLSALARGRIRANERFVVCSVAFILADLSCLEDLQVLPWTCLQSPAVFVTLFTTILLLVALHASPHQMLQP